MINNKKQQEKEVKRWWNYPRNLRWDTFYDENNPDRHHVIERQKKTLERVDALNLPNGAKILELLAFIFFITSPIKFSLTGAV